MQGCDIVVRGLPSGYEVEHVARVFFPDAGVRQGAGTKGPLVYARLGKSGRMAAAVRDADGCHISRAMLQTGEPAKTQLSRLLYRLLRCVTGQRPPWGMLTGVRPVRYLRNMRAALGEEGAKPHFLHSFDVSDAKYRLIEGIHTLQAPFLQDADPLDYSLYVSIPFCPTRCSYCSFVSQTIEREGELIPLYLQRLREELAFTAETARACGLRLRSVYVGGGTPTALSVPRLAALLEDLERIFSASKTAEYTVEAGRPDCTSYEKLALLRQAGVTRLSINPQSLAQPVLDAIGRRHTADDIRRCMADARRAGHDNINMDVIAGLPMDTGRAFGDTINGVLEMAPENITLHTLTLKRGSFLREAGREAATSPGQMLETAYPLLGGAGYAPYYLYRQKSTVENLENTGWARPGKEGLYNMYIMEECHSILAVGAGASTKLVGGGGSVIRRSYNPKYPADYNQNMESIITKKRGVNTFYAGYLDSQTIG